MPALKPPKGEERARTQKPLYVGNRDFPIFASEGEAGDFEERSRQAIEYLVRRVPVADVARDLLVALNTEPAWQAIAVLEPMIRENKLRGEPFPEGWLNLGIAYAAVGNYKQAIIALEQAVTLFEMPDDGMTSEKSLYSGAAALLHDAYYQLGVALYKSGDDLEAAISRLKKAVQVNPSNTQARFYLGQALRAMVEQVERTALSEAEQEFRTYLDQGAPLGHEEEVQAFLEARKPKQMPKTKQKK